jgi:hypothetical protein
MTPADAMALRQEAEAALRKYPGVVAVGLGTRERGGMPTDEIAWRVYVRAKKEESALRPGERVPREWRGVPTDVIEETRDWTPSEPQHIERRDLRRDAGDPRREAEA